MLGLVPAAVAALDLASKVMTHVRYSAGLWLSPCGTRGQFNTSRALPQEDRKPIWGFSWDLGVFWLMMVCEADAVWYVQTNLLTIQGFQTLNFRCWAELWHEW